MIKHNNKQIGFIYRGNKLINKIIHNNKTYYEKGFLRETIGASPLTMRGVGLPIKNYEIFGNTTQETTTGKNLFNYITTFNKSLAGLTNTLNENGNITISGKPASSYVRVVGAYNITDMLEDGKTYTLVSTFNTTLIVFQLTLVKADGSGNDYIGAYTSARKFVVDKTKYSSYSIMLQTSSLSTWGDEERTFTGTAMLYKGEGNDTFEKYTGGIASPSPDYPQEIESVGDLVTDTTDENYGKYKIPVNVKSENACFNILSKETKTKYATTLTIEYIEGKLKPDTYYTIIGKCTPNSKFYIDKTNNTISSGCVNVNVGDDGILFYNIQTLSDLSSLTPSSFEGKLALQILKVNRDGNDELPNYSDLMIVEGKYTRATIPPYQPYYNTTTNIYLNAPLRKIGDYADYVDFKEGKVVKNIENVILNGSETGWMNGSTQNYFGYSNFKFPLSPKGSAIVPSFSNFFMSETFDALYSKRKDYGFAFAYNTRRVIFRNKDIETLNDFKTWLSTHNVEVDYILETPTEETIELPSILTTNGTNIISIDTKTLPSNIYLKHKSEV